MRWIQDSVTFPLPLVLFGPLAGCGTAGDVAEDLFQVHDSAGVEVILNSARAVADARPLALHEEVRIGAVDGPAELQFYRVRAVREAPNGDIVVLDGGNNAVRVFDAQGGFLYQFGEQGDGPGAFRSPFRLAIAGDTILAGDRELSFFLRGDHILTTAALDTGYAISTSLIERTEQGWVAARRRRGYGIGDEVTRGGPFTDTMIVGPFDPTRGTLLDTTLVLAIGERYLLGDAAWILQPLFARDRELAVAQNGRIYFTSADDYVIDVVDTSGKHLRRIKAEIEKIPVTPEHFEQYLDRRRAAAGPSPSGEAGGSLRTAETEYREVPLPPFRPIPGSILAAPNGRLLVERVDLGPAPREEWDQGTTWDLFDIDGRIEGRIVIPATIALARLTDDAVYAVVRDEMNVQFVARYRLTPVGEP